MCGGGGGCVRACVRTYVRTRAQVSTHACLGNEECKDGESFISLASATPSFQHVLVLRHTPADGRERERGGGGGSGGRGEREGGRG